MGKSAKTLSEALDEYEGYLKAKRMRPNTTKNYMGLLRKALALWGNIYVASISPRHVDRLFGSHEWMPRTHNTHLATMRLFFGWCRNQGYLPLNSDPCFGWRNMKVPDTERLRIPVEEFATLLDTADHPRDRAQIACGLFLFVRGSELELLRVGDLDFQRSTVRIYRLKTQEEDVLPMCDELREELVRYLNWYREDQGTLRDDWYLLPARHATEWRPAGYRKMVPPDKPGSVRPGIRQTDTYKVVQRVLRKLGYPTLREGEHTLRRSGARAWADTLREQGYDGALLQVASMLGHKDTKLTEHYIGWSLERAKRNETLAGKPMFPALREQRGKVLRVVEEG